MRTQTVASYFRYSLMDLLSKMVAGQPHFVRCIKPNNDRHARKFDKEKVLIQLRYTGILETAKIRRQGYSHRILFGNFIKRYYILAFRANEEPAGSPETCVTILEKAKLENWVLGKTKVFLKYYHVEHLNLLIRQTSDRIVLLQACVRGWLTFRNFQKVLEKREQSAVVLQSAYRGHKVRRQVADDKSKAKTETIWIQFQAVCRGHLARKRYKELLDEKNKAAAKIQAQYRGQRDRKSFKKKKEAMQKEKVLEEGDVREETSPRADSPSPADQAVENVGADADEKAAVVLQSNYRGYRERKKYKEHQERSKTPAGHELAGSSTGPEEDSYEPGIQAEEEKEEEGEEEGDSEQESKAATVLQSNFRGHKERKRLQEEGKLPASGKKATSCPTEEQESALECSVREEPAETGEGQEEGEEGRAAVVLQSNFRDQGAPTDPETTAEHIGSGPVEIDEDRAATATDEDRAATVTDEDRAATVLQSNFRGHKERKRLKTQKEGDQGATEEMEDDLEVTEIQPRCDDKTEEEEGCDEEQAAVKIQSNFRGYKDRKNLKATAQKEEEEVASFSQQISSLSEDYLALQHKLNVIIQARQLSLASEGVFVKGQALNGHAGSEPQQSADVKQARTPRRAQKPKTLNTPEDSTYYNLIHRSVKDDRKRPRKQSPKKLLDTDDHYYQALSSSKSAGSPPSYTCTPTDLGVPGDGRRCTERTLSDIPKTDTPKPPKENRHSFPRMPSTESQSEDNPYDYRKLLRKTSQRGRLIKQH